MNRRRWLALVVVVSVMTGWVLNGWTRRYGGGDMAFLTLFGLVFAVGGYSYRALSVAAETDLLRRRLHDEQRARQRAESQAWSKAQENHKLKRGPW